MISILTFKWRPPPGYRSTFGAAQVNTLASMVRRHYPNPHRFICVTDDARGIDDSIETYRLWDDFGTLRNPSGLKNPSCYRRLRVFARNAGDWLGDRFVCLDLDAVVVDDLRPLWDRDDEFVIWKSTTPGNPYNGSMFLLRAGARAEVWESFDPDRSPAETKAAGYYGSDQAFIAHCLGRGEKTWGPGDGVFSFRNDVSGKNLLRPPAGARIVFFHGRGDPWSPEVYNRHAWIRDAYK